MTEIKKFDFSQQKLETELARLLVNQVAKQELAFYLTFFILLLTFEIALIVNQQQYWFYILPKIILNIIIILIIGIKNISISYRLINKLIIITKFLTILLIILINQDFILIFILLLEENQIQIVRIEKYIERFIIKISLLVLLIIQSNFINIIIGICILIFEIARLVLMLFKTKDTINLHKSQNHVSINYEENTYASRMSTVQLSYFIISKENNSIKFKNKNFSKQFRSICKTDEEYNELIFNKMKFQIISRHNIQDDDCISQQRKKDLIRRSLIKITEASEDFINIFEKKDSSLSEILQSYEDNLQKMSEKPKMQTLEFHSQLVWDQCNDKITTYVGQILLIDQDDDIIVTLNDITQQNKIQEEKIKDQFKSTIIQSFSHELRTPLNSALNFLQYCQNDNSVNEEIKQNFISPAINALRLQSYLINDIIDFSYLCSDNLVLDVAQINIFFILDEINKLFKSILLMKKIQLYIDFRKNVIETIRTDFPRLIQILANLIQNSIKFSSEGVIIVKFSSTSQEVLKITIIDQGLGINEQQLFKIRKLLTDIEERKTFSQFETWHGFGLLISSMLIQKLKPANHCSLQIFSEGLNQGTKVKFFIRNYTVTQQDFSSLVINENSKQAQSSKFYSSLQQSNIFAINRKLILISNQDVCFDYNGDIQKKMKLKQNNSNVNKELISCDNSALSSIFIDVNFELQIGDFKNMHPFQFQNYQISREQEKFQEYSSVRIQNYEDIKVKEKQENNQQMNLFFSQRSCTCKTILSVDDEIFNQKSIQFLLKQNGFDVVLAFNGLQAIDIVKSRKKCSPNCCLFIVILMDYQMPLMNGIETTKALRQLMDNQEIPNINIVGLTAFNSKNDIDECLKSGMSTVMIKPLILKEFFSILQQI